MSFVAEVLEILSFSLPNRRYKNSIEDIENTLIKYGAEGKTVTLPKQFDEEYMKNVGLKDKLSSFFRLFYRLYGKRGI